jgi:hypothetical protein
MTASIRHVTVNATYFDVVTELGVRIDANWVQASNRWYAHYEVTGQPVVIHSDTYWDVVRACSPLLDEPEQYSI